MTDKITYKRALEMMNEERSQMVSINRQEHLALHPKYMGNLKQGVTTMLDSQMSLYQNRFEGVPIAYNNVKMVQPKASNISYQPFLHFDITADFIIFKPDIGSSLKGVIQKVETDHISCLVHGVFNAWCPKGPVLAAVKDANPLSLMGSEVEFKVTKLSSNNGVLSLRGAFTKVLKKRSASFVSSTPALNKKTTFDDNEDDACDSPSLDQSFNPALTSTQIETPYISKDRPRKRKLSNVFEDELGTDDSNQHESGIGDMDGDSGSKARKKKKKKHKHDDHGVNSSVNSEMTSSILSDSLKSPIGFKEGGIVNIKPKKKEKKTKHDDYGKNLSVKSERTSSSVNDSVQSPNKKSKKQEKKHKLDDHGVNSSVNIEMTSSIVSGVKEGETVNKNIKKKKKHKDVNIDSTINSVNNSSIVNDSIKSQNMDVVNKKSINNSSITNNDSSKSQNIDKVNKRKAEKRKHVKVVYSARSPSPELTEKVPNTLAKPRSDVPHKKGKIKKSGSDKSVPSIDDFFKNHIDGMIADQSDKTAEVYPKHVEREIDTSTGSHDTKNRTGESGGETVKKKEKKKNNKKDKSEIDTELSASMDDFVTEKTQGKKKKKKSKLKSGIDV